MRKQVIHEHANISVVYNTLEPFFLTFKTSTNLNLTAAGPYSVEIIPHDRAGNHKTARRIVLFDDNSVVDKKGDDPEVVQANQYFWITEDSDRIDVRWPGRYINRRHHDQGWLNAVKEKAEVSSELDDHQAISDRNVQEFHNIEGIFYFIFPSKLANVKMTKVS